MSMRLMNIQKDIWSHCTPHVLRVQFSLSQMLRHEKIIYGFSIADV